MSSFALRRHIGDIREIRSLECVCKMRTAGCNEKMLLEGGASRFGVGTDACDRLSIEKGKFMRTSYWWNGNMINVVYS